VERRLHARPHDRGDLAGRFERFFRESLDITDGRVPDMAEIAELGARYQQSFPRPEWLPDVIARYNLTPPPG
jgi:hypothetical protein